MIVTIVCKDIINCKVTIVLCNRALISILQSNVISLIWSQTCMISGCLRGRKYYLGQAFQHYLTHWRPLDFARTYFPIDHSSSIPHAPGGGGGGGYFHICMHIGYVPPRERPPLSTLNFRSGAYHFHKWPTNPVWSITTLHFLPFRRPSFSTFLECQPLHCFPRPAQPGLAAGQSASQTRPGSSGDPHFHVQNGSSSVRSPAFSRSTVELGPEPGPFFTLPRHISTNIWGEYPPPPQGPCYM